jgi:hypothetical protein
MLRLARHLLAASAIGSVLLGSGGLHAQPANMDGEPRGTVAWSTATETAATAAPEFTGAPAAEGERPQDVSDGTGLPVAALPVDEPRAAASDFWIPYTATPVPDTTGGKSGVFVIPSGRLTAKPSIVSTSTATLYLDVGINSTLSHKGKAPAYSPATYLFAATDASNNIHVYGLNLTAASTPIATQIGTLSLPLPSGKAIETVICDSSGSPTNDLDGTSVFLVLHIAGATGCNTTGDVWEVVHYTDSTSTAPAVVNITTTGMTPLYDPSGALAGLVVLDPATHNLYLYADESFTHPTTLVPGDGATQIDLLYNTGSRVLVFGGPSNGTVLFMSLTNAAGSFLYRISYSGAITKEYTAAGAVGGGVADATNLYFADSLPTQHSDTTTVNLWQLPLKGGKARELYSATDILLAKPIGSNGSLLVFSTLSATSTTTLYSVPIGELSSTATLLGGPYASVVYTSLLPTTFGNLATDLLFVTLESHTGGSTSFSTEILSPAGGSPRQPLTGNSFWFANATSALAGSVLEVTGITDTTGGFGGASIDAVNLSTLTPTTLKAPGGAVYTVPAGDDLVIEPLSNHIGAGEIVPGISTEARLGSAYSLSADRFVPISLTNTNISVVL